MCESERERGRGRERQRGREGQIGGKRDIETERERERARDRESARERESERERASEREADAVPLIVVTGHHQDHRSGPVSHLMSRPSGSATVLISHQNDTRKRTYAQKMERSERYNIVQGFTTIQPTIPKP